MKKLIWGVFLVVILVLLFTFKGSAPVDTSGSWVSTRNSEAVFASYAEQLGLDLEQFESDYESDEVEDKVENDYADVVATGIQISTPTVLINGKLVERTISNLRQILDAELLAASGAGVAPTGESYAIPAVSDNDNRRGNLESPVTFVEYGDFQCPACGQFHNTVVVLVEEYGDRVQFVYRHMPLTQIHPKATPAAHASEAAGRQGKFWEMHDLLYENQ